MDGDHGHERGIDAAGQRDERTLETAFVRVVAEAEREGLEGVLPFVLGERRGESDGELRVES